MVGLIGTDKLSKDAVMWNKWTLGSTYAWNGMASIDIIWNENKNEFYDIKAIDGMFMATQYDIEWREDLKLGWDYYDISHSLEFIRQNLKIAVICSKNHYALHDCGCSKLENYENGRRIMLEEYKDFFGEKFKETDYSQIYMLFRKVLLREEERIEAADYEGLLLIDDMVVKKNWHIRIYG